MIYRPWIGPDADEAQAQGTRFNHARVVEIAALFAETFVSQLAAANLHGTQPWAMPDVLDEGDRWPYETAKFVDALHRRFLVDDAHLDVSGSRITLHAAPFHARFYLKGAEWLVRNGDHGLVRLGGEPAEGLDPMPVIMIARDDDYAVHDPNERAMLTALFEGFRAQHGLRFATASDGLVQPAPALWFGHERYGNGVGAMRLLLRRTP